MPSAVLAELFAVKHYLFCAMASFSRLIDNLTSVKQRIADAARRSSRPATSVKLVAVTKYAPAGVIQKLIAAGCHDLGESRPQSLWAKAEQLTGQAVNWHLIGHLQRNKIQRTLPLASLIHSADSLRLLQALSEAAVAIQHRVLLLLEINISGDATKHGFTPNEIELHLPAIATLPNLEIQGLMGMASLEGDLDQARQDFARLRKLRDRLKRIAPTQIKLDELSMGMSGDFEIAIEEGATIVRVGSALFEGVDA